MAEIDLSELSEAERSAFAGQRIGKRKGKVREPVEPSVDWNSFASTFCLPFNMILRALDAPVMKDFQEKSFANAWGMVIEKYAPDLGEWKEEITAGIVTFAIFGPAVKTYMEKQKETSEVPAGDGGRSTNL